VKLAVRVYEENPGARMRNVIDSEKVALPPIQNQEARSLL